MAKKGSEQEKPWSRRYQVQPVDHEVMPTGEAYVDFDRLDDALAMAPCAGPFGGAVIDTQTGLVDVGRGWVEQDQLEQHIAEQWPEEREAER